MLKLRPFSTVDCKLALALSFTTLRAHYLYIVCQLFPVQTMRRKFQTLEDTHTHTPEVVSAISLTKTAARNETDAGVLQKLHAVEHVWSLTLRLYSHTDKQAMKSMIPLSRRHEEHVTQSDLGFVDGALR